MEQQTAAASKIVLSSAADQRSAFYASVRAIDALCPMCKREQSSPSCERREHWG